MSHDSGFEVWQQIAAKYPADHFTSVEGQTLASTVYRGVPRPAGWSLPAELGPWPEAREDTAERIICLLPGVSAAIVGDFIAGPWRTRSTSYALIGEKHLRALQSKGMATFSNEPHWIGWRPLRSFIPALAAFEPHSPAVRAFIDRRRLAILDATAFKMLAERREADEKHLAALLARPEADRDAAWAAETALYREVVRDWGRAR